MKSRFMALLMPIILGSVALAPYQMGTAPSFSPAAAQAQVLPEQPSGSFELDINHIAQTITTQEAAIYYIEVSRQDASEQPINLSVANQNSSLSYKLEPRQISKTGLVKLSVKARDVSGAFNQYPIVVKAQMASPIGEVVRCISTWLFVVAPPPSQTIVTLAARPEMPLVNGVLQPMEGRIVPPKPGNVVLALLNPDQVLKKIPLSVDSLGRFSHNHVYRKPGPWQAAVLSEAGSDSFKSLISGAQFAKAAVNFDNNKPISFQVAKRTPRITVTTVDSRNKKIGDRLEIVGQLVADTANVQVQIEVVSPRNETTTLYVPSEPETGQFRAFYSIADTGLHTITASANQLQIPQPPSCGQVIEGTKLQIQQRIGASQDGGIMPVLRQQTRGPNWEGEGISELTVSAPPSAPPSGGAQAQVGATNGYAIILVGGFNGNDLPLLNKQNNIAAFLYERLKARGFSDNDILLLSQSQCVQGYLTRDDASSNYVSAITNFLPQVGNRTGKNLFVYLIGRVTTTGGNKYVIYNDPPAYQTTEIAFTDLAAFFSNTFFSGFSRVVCMVAFDYGGAFLSQITGTGTTPKIINLSNTGNANTLGSNDWDDPEACFTGRVAKKFSEGINIRDAFYDIYNYFYTKAPMLDDNDNGVNNEPNGSFENANSSSPPLFPDGIHSLNEFIGVNSGGQQVSASVTGGTTGSSPAGPLHSQHARVLATLDNPNRFPVESVTATISPPPNSNLSVVEVPLALDSTSGIYESESVCFPDSGLYRFEIDLSYLDGTGEKFSSFDFAKTRHIVAASQDTIESPSVFFDPHIEVGFNYARGFDPPNVRNSQNKPGGVIDVNFYSTHSGNLEFLGLGVASNFDRFWGVFMPMSVSAGRFTALSNLWIYGGFGYELGNAKFIQEDLLYFVGLKYRLFSLKH